MPLLARMIVAPLVVDVRRGALRDLAAVLADQRISSGGRVAVALGVSSAAAVRDALGDQLSRADFFSVCGGTVNDALALAKQAQEGRYDAMVGVGGGKVLDAAKFAAARLGLPMVAVATNLAHDGIGSPVSILDNDGGRGSYGVPAPIAVLVDLDLVLLAPARALRAGVGEAVSNLSAIEDWHLSHDRLGEPVDGLAVMLARLAGQAVLQHPSGIETDEFLTTLAESLIMSGVAMVVAGSSRPCSGACHEISHAIDLLYRGRRSYHGEQVGLGAAFATWLRRDERGLEQIVGALRRHGLPVVPLDLDLEEHEFARAVVHAPETRPGRHTILEELSLSTDDVHMAVKDYVKAVS